MTDSVHPEFASLDAHKELFFALDSALHHDRPESLKYLGNSTLGYQAKEPLQEIGYLVEARPIKRDNVFFLAPRHTSMLWWDYSYRSPRSVIATSLLTAQFDSRVRILAPSPLSFYFFLVNIYNSRIHDFVGSVQQSD